MCEYCTDNSFLGNELLIEFDDNEDLKDTVKVYVTNDAKLFLHNNYGAMMTNINYCPMCGRKLEEGETNA